MKQRSLFFRRLVIHAPKALLLLSLTGLGNTAHAFCAGALIKEIQRIAQMGSLVDEVKTGNARQLSKEDITTLDRQWVKHSGKLPEAQKILASNASRVLSEEIKKRVYFTEAILTGNQGETIGMNMVTTDYWQGDEEKFTEVFDTNIPSRKADSHISRARWDDSSKTMIAQVSVPVYDGDIMIGTLTVGVDLKRVPQHTH